MVKIFNDFKMSHPTERPLSVLMMGIDSVSRINLRRAMPNTAEYLVGNNWFELEGYNKVNSLIDLKIDLYLSTQSKPDRRQHLSKSHGSPYRYRTRKSQC